MSVFKLVTVLIFSAALAMTGCALRKPQTLPVHDEVLRYDLPYDLTYLRTIEALENVENWELEETEKEKGLITVRNINHSSFDDSDLRVATVHVTRVSRKETTVAFAPDSQRVVGGDQLLERVRYYLSREVSH